MRKLRHKKIQPVIPEHFHGGKGEASQWKPETGLPEGHLDPSGWFSDWKCYSSEPLTRALTSQFSGNSSGMCKCKCSHTQHRHRGHPGHTDTHSEADGTGAVPTRPHRAAHSSGRPREKDTPVSASIPTHRLLCPPNGPVGSVASHGRPRAPCPGPSLCRHPFGPGIFILQSVCSVSTVDCRPRSNHCPCSASFPRNRASGVVGLGGWLLTLPPTPGAAEGTAGRGEWTNPGLPSSRLSVMLIPSAFDPLP